ncbi:MAG TPA: TM0106 family RecB-like putative nuclease [Spirochaetia bacterium]|nr:TM0106 family RecB-like putative nuclease [Spirochaetia bacterium]
MFQDGGTLRLAATDISNHLACAHLTQLNRGVAEGRRAAPTWSDPSLAVLQQRGFEHERAYIRHLRGRGFDIVEPAEEGGRLSVEKTLAAMRSGAQVIVQAELRHERWLGRADLLLRVDTPSRLGLWSYEVADTKLAQETRAGTVLQLCLYSELVARIQGLNPALMHVVKPGPDFPRESFRWDDFSAYYRLARKRLEDAMAAPPSSATYPDPVPHCDICRWWKECDARRHADDNLCLVAGIRPLHIEEIERQGTMTLTEFADAEKPLREKPRRGNPEAFARAHGQARVQLDGRRAAEPRYELLPPEPGLGFHRLPEPDEGDIFLDIESDPFAGDGGMEYLLGMIMMARGKTPGKTPEYRALWGLTPREEEKSLEQFIDIAMESWKAHPGMHVYHYSPYEPGAIKRLIGRHGTREAELDMLLRAERFVDLLAVTRQGLRASVESYSLKALEPFFGFNRALDLPAAGAALRRIARALELAGPGDITAEDRAAVEAYNRDDCLSTSALRDWLEARRAEAGAAHGTPIERPLNKSGDASDAIEQRAADIQVVYDLLVEGLPEDRETWGPPERARWLLAHQLEYFRREDKCAWWEFFRIHALDHEELLEERKAIAGLRFTGAAGSAGRSLVHRYSFPEQEAAFDEGDELYEVGGETVGRVHSIDLAAHVLEIAKNGRSTDIHPEAVMVNDHVRPAPVDSALLALARSIARNGVDGPGPHRAARDLLLAGRPRLNDPSPGALRRKGEGVVEAAVRLAQGLDNSFLPIQGPPGSGKTYTGARMIASLARQGKRIGVTAVSHKVIQKLLKEALAAAAETGVSLKAIRKDRKSDGEIIEGVEITKDDAPLRSGLAHGWVVGGTAWFWSKEDMVDSLDYLFIDEAGQMSLAHALATARSARNLVLLGDPQQLEQPQRGAHPEGAEVAALVHILGRQKTIADEAGLFLDETWRLHPDICAFTSELFYENRLESRAGLEKQRLTGDTPFAGSGLFYVPVDHSGNQNSSLEEVEAVERIVRNLRAEGITWTNRHGQSSPLGPEDVLVVAPYNAQVAALTRRLGDAAQVGTVDKFQGQQAPVVVYSMTSSSAQDAPRGMSFLFSPNRLNVATSRARCASILVAAPRLLEPDCSSPDQMRWANGPCRYREMAREVRLEDASLVRRPSTPPRFP